jgi:hypothetical protein
MTNQVPESPTPSAAGIENSSIEVALPADGNIPFALAAGIVAAVVGAAIWAGVTVATEYQIGWMAVGVGFLVGIAVRQFGKGSTPVYGVIGAALAFLGCVLGNVLTLVAFFGIGEEISFFTALGAIDFTQVPTILIETGSPIDLLFYGIAISVGYKTSMVQTNAG